RDRALVANAALLEDQGRQELLAGHPSRALAYLSAAYSAGADGPSMRYLLHVVMRNLEALQLTTDGAREKGATDVFGAGRIAVSRQSGAEVVDARTGAVLLSFTGESQARFTP